MREPEKFVVRLLDAHGTLLSWASIYAQPSPQERGGSSPFFAPGPTEFRIEQAGEATEISVHWCDLDVARRAAVITPMQVEPLQRVIYTWIEPVWLVPGMRDVPLPAVTMRAPVTIETPMGSVTALA